MAKIFWANGSFAPLSWRPEQIAHGRSFVLNDLRDPLTSLISSERSERFAHDRSFVLSYLSESLTAAHLIGAKWANERWGNERSPSPAFKCRLAIINGNIKWVLLWRNKSSHYMLIYKLEKGHTPLLPPLTIILLRQHFGNSPPLFLYRYWVTSLTDSLTHWCWGNGLWMRIWV